MPKKRKSLFLNIGAAESVPSLNLPLGSPLPIQNLMTLRTPSLVGGALAALIAIGFLVPTNAEAQSHRHHKSHGYKSHHKYHGHHYGHRRGGVRVVVAPRRVVSHSHYRGPIYYRYPSAYSRGCATTYARRPAVVYRSVRTVAPRRVYYPSYGVRICR